MADDYTGWPKVSVAQRMLGYHVRIERLLRDGELRFAVVPGGPRGHRLVDPVTLEAAIAKRAGLRDITEARERIATLEDRVRDLDEQIAILRGERKPRYTSAQLRAAEDALYVLSLEESLEILSRIDPSDDSQGRQDRYAIYDAEGKIQRQIDERDAPQFIGKRPRGVNKNAKRRTISTGIGEVDIWYWTTRSHRWVAGYGGPRAIWPGARGGYDTAASAIKAAGQQARHAYGKPTRKSSARLRFDVLERCGFACVYCGRRPSDVELHVDHVVPVAKGGSNELHNLVAACRDCNLGKHSRDLAEPEPVPDPVSE